MQGLDPRSSDGLFLSPLIVLFRHPDSRVWIRQETPYEKLLSLNSACHCALEGHGLVWTDYRKLNGRALVQ